MKNTGPYLFVLTIFLLLVRHIVQAIQTVLVKRTRIIFSLFRMQIGSTERAMMITADRSVETIVSPDSTSSFAHNVSLNQTTLRSRRLI